MKCLVLILCFAQIASAQRMAYNRLSENIESNSPSMIVNTTFESGDLPDSSGWIGEYNLLLRVTSDPLNKTMSLSCGEPRNPLYYFTYGGIATGFTFPAGSTLKVNYEYWNITAGYAWFRSWMIEDGCFKDVGDSVRSRQGRFHFGDYSYTTSPTARHGHQLFNLTNGGFIQPILPEPQINPAYSGIALDTMTVIRIRFRIDIGATEGKLRLKWSTLFLDPSADPVYPALGDDFGGWVTIIDEETEEVTHVWVPATFSGTPNFSTTVLRGSSFIAHRIY